MRISRSSIVLSALSLLALIPLSAAQTSEGCFKDDGSLISQGTWAYQSEGYCYGVCQALGYSVFAMSDANACSCGNSLPDSGTTVSSSLCNLSCVGYPDNICGGDGYYSVWITGSGTVSNSAASSAGVTSLTTTTKKATTTSSTSSSTTTPAASVIYITTAVVQQGVTVIQTVSASTRSASASSASSSSSSSSSKASSSSSGISGGAIAGIVIGVLALAAIGVLVAFFLLRRRRRESDEFAGEYKRQIEPAGAGIVRSHPSSPDNRLDTSLAIRRNSSESLADNQDYSRKILRVVN